MSQEETTTEVVEAPKSIGEIAAKHFTPKEEPTETPQSESQTASAESKPGEASPEERLLSERLAEIARREAEVREQQEALKAKPAEDEAGDKSPEDPLAVLREAGLTNADIQAILLSQELGEDTPEEVKEQLNKLSQSQRLKKLEEELGKSKEKPQFDEEAIIEKAKMAARIEAKQEEINSFMASIPADLSLLSAVAKEEAAEIQDAMEQVTATIVKTEGRWPSAREVADFVEQNLKEEAMKWQRLSGSLKTAEPQTKPTESNTRQAEPLSDADVSQLPDRGAPENLTFEERLERAKSNLAARRSSITG